MLALSHQHSLLPYTIAIVAALTIPEVLLETPIEIKEIVEGKSRLDSIHYDNFFNLNWVWINVNIVQKRNINKNKSNA